MREYVLGLLMAIAALAGCTSSEGQSMAEAAQRSSDIATCQNQAIKGERENPSITDPYPHLTEDGLFMRCMSQRGWNMRLGPRTNQWGKQTEDALGKQNPGGECRFEFNAQVRDTIVVPVLIAKRARMVIGTTGTAQFDPGDFKLDTPEMKRQHGWIILTFYPKENLASGPDLLITVDPCTTKVIQTELHYDA